MSFSQPISPISYSTYRLQPLNAIATTIYHKQSLTKWCQIHHNICHSQFLTYLSLSLVANSHYISIIRDRTCVYLMSQSLKCQQLYSSLFMCIHTQWQQFEISLYWTLVECYCTQHCVFMTEQETTMAWCWRKVLADWSHLSNVSINKSYKLNNIRDISHSASSLVQTCKSTLQGSP